MNNKKVTKCKGSKSKKNDDSAEVFVLPPNLLEKLGIKLGNMETTPESTEYLVSDKNSFSEATDVDQEKHILNIASENFLQSESSIIETANLMKKSVFLSPTFISNNTCTIQGEVEIVGNADLIKVSSDTRISKLNALRNNEYDVSGHKTREDVSLNIQQESVPLADLKNSSSALTSVPTQDTNKDGLFTNGDVEIRNVEYENIFNDYAHDACSFDCSNCNIGLTDKDDELNNFNSLQECENYPSKSKKINIISEQILDSSQLKVFQKCYSPNFNSLIPVTMNTVVKSHYQNSIYYQNSNDVNCISTLITDGIHPPKSGVKDLSDVNKPNYVKESLLTLEAIPEGNYSKSCNILSNASDETLIPIQEQESSNLDDKISQVSTGVIKEHVNEVDTDVLVSFTVDSVVERNVDTKGTLGKINSVVAKSKNKDNKNKVNETSEIINTNTFKSKNSYNDIHLKHLAEKNLEINNLPPTDENKSRLTLQNVDNHLKESNNITLRKNNLSEGFVNNNLFLNKNHTEFHFNDTKQNLDNKKNVSMELLRVKHEANQSASNFLPKKGSLNDSITSQSSKKKECGKNEPDNQQSTADLDYGEHYDKAKLDNSGSGPRESTSHHDVQHDRLKNTTDVQEDKVKEIAKYLSKFADMQKKRTFHEMRNISNTKTSTNRKQATYSKLSIQGVEKPGGSGINKYGRNIGKYEQKQKERPTVKNTFNAYQHFETSTHEIDLIDNISAKTYNENELCLCDDFGCLIFYGNESKYEHIHFWNRNRIDCTPEEVFSIYTDDGPGSKINDDYADDGVTFDKNDFTLKNISVCTDRKVCWNEIELNVENNLVGNRMEKVLLRFEKDAQNISEKSKTPCVVREILPEFPNSNGSPKTSTQIVHNNEMLTANLLQHCQGSSIHSKMNPKSYANPTKNGKKRKCSTFLGESDEPPAKKLGVSENKLTLRTESEKDTIELSFAEEKNPEKVLPDVGANSERPSVSNELSTATCGVCRQNVEDTVWLQHIALNHNYLSWKVGESPLDFENKQIIIQYLSRLIKQYAVLICNKCGNTSISAKSFLRHVKHCGVEEISKTERTFNASSEVNSEVASVKHVGGSNVNAQNDSAPVNDDSITCGVCGESVQGKDWNNHLESRHDYLAWRHGEPTVDLDDEKAVREHLYNITKKCGVLKCSKCGLTKKYVKAYLNHFKSCLGPSDKIDSSLNASSDMASDIESVKHGSGSGSIGTVHIKTEPTTVDDLSIKCAVCGERMQVTDWNSHIELQHDYLAWKCGELTLDVNDENAVREHLNNIAKELGRLKCSKCGLIRKYVKAYLTHFKNCSEPSKSQNESTLNASSKVSEGKVVKRVSRSISNVNAEKVYALVNNELVKCGVCGESLQDKDWNCHIESRHDYLAWKYGEPPLDVDDENMVREYLSSITKECGGLKCSKCGLTRKYVKAYLTHFKNCNGLSDDIDSALNASADVISGVESEPHAGGTISNVNVVVANEGAPVNNELVKCGVCGECLQDKDWTIHIESRHDYLAWKYGEPPLNVYDEEAVREHLYDITKECGGLKCSKCGLTRKYVKAYLTHFKNCNGLSDDIDSALNASADVISGVESEPHAGGTISNVNVVVANEGAPVNNELVKCGVCGECLQDKDWTIHIESRHDYLAWKYGEPPLNVYDEEAVREHLYDITKECGGLKCSKCGLTRKYVKGYLTHFKSCLGPSTVEGRRVSLNKAPSIEVLLNVKQESLTDADLIKCGVCGQYMRLLDWTVHIAENHDYLAWKEGEPPVDVQNYEEVLQHLQNLVKEIGSLVCSKCGSTRKYATPYLQHLRRCNGSKHSSADLVKCAVCSEAVEASRWIKHIAEQHEYFAWKEGETPVDFNNEGHVYQHLSDIVKQCGALTCKKCGNRRRVVKSYMEHIKTCGQDVSMTADFEEISAPDLNGSHVDFDSGGTCGVCQKQVEAGKWIQHTHKYHNYLAWRQGEKPWDLDNAAELNVYLYEIAKKMDGLTCNKCGLVRKYVKAYLTHIKNCSVIDFNLNTSDPQGIGPISDKDLYQCAMCKQEIKASHWKDHAMKKHYNITWIIGQTPIDIKNPYAVEKYLKEYRLKYGLKCTKCGARRASFAGFYAHIITCGKTEEEIEMFQSTCDICNNTYLCIYKNQHMMIHKVQDYTKELKMKVSERKEEKEKEQEVHIVSGKRRAAQKARSVIENYSNDLSQHAHKCESCGFGTDFKEEIQSHRCDKSAAKDFSEVESSEAEMEGSNDESESQIDSDISYEENEELTKKEKDRRKKSDKSVVNSKVSRIPFKVENPNLYVLQSDSDFCNRHFTDETLFSQWLSCEREVVSEYDLSKYLPSIEESCKVKAGFNWTTLKRFEAIKGDGISIFVGACIVSIAWVPPRMDSIVNGKHNFLAVACHNGVDCPRYQCDETPHHKNLIQIWDFGACRELPKIVYGIAHDFGTVWSIDWCPSGARERLPEALEDGKTYRLGLLAVACSNGSAYVFSVPYPSTVVIKNRFVHKLRPVAELRMTMNSERQLYQATSVTWSKEKGHTIVLVGYADGSTALYDLNCESPLLRTFENNVEVFYPYHDERPHNTSIIATDMFPGSRCGAGVVCSAGATGADMAAGGARVRSHLASHAALFAPHWPGVMLAGDVTIMNTAMNELEWSAPARRLGGVRSLAGCARCGRVAAATPPALRLMRPHPAFPECRKTIVAMLEMTRLGNKRKKQVNDELAMVVEPLTYADAVAKYGIEFETIKKTDKASQQKCAAKPRTHCPERFPLADVKSMAFCPSKRHHDKLAIATHSVVVKSTV